MTTETSTTPNADNTVTVAGVTFRVEQLSYSPEPRYSVTLPDGRELTVELDGEDQQLDWALTIRTAGGEQDTVLLNAGIHEAAEGILTEALDAAGA